MTTTRETVRPSWSAVLGSLFFIGIFHLKYLDALVGSQQEVSGCFGSTYDTFLRPNCSGSPGHMIAIRQVYVGGKPRSQSCPDEATDNNTSPDCCLFHPDDCFFPYSGLSRNFYFDNCTGQPYCILGVTRDRIDGTGKCNDSIYRPFTNYMFNHMFCVDNTSVLHMGGNQAKTEAAVYLANHGYPDASAASGNCSVTTSCDTNILVTRVDLRLEATQTLRFINASGSVSAPLSHLNSTRGIYALQAPPGNYLRVELVSLATDEGHVWLQFNASDTRATVTVSCGSSMEAPPVNVTSCDDVTTTPATTTTTVTVSGSETTTERSSSGGVNIGAIVGGIIGGLAVIAIIGGVVYWLKYYKRKVEQEPGNDDSLFNGAKQQMGQVAPRATASRLGH